MSGAPTLRLRPGVRLAPLTPDHAQSMYRWMCDPVVRKNVGLRREPSLDATLAWITAAQNDDSIYPYGILLDELHVGNVILDRLDRYLSTGRLSVYIGETASRGAGIGLTGIYHLLATGFGDLDLRKIWLTVYAGNIPAITTYTRLGFALEGILREEFLLDGQRHSALYMGLLRDDFRRLAVVIN